VKGELTTWGEERWHHRWRPEMKKERRLKRKNIDKEGENKKAEKKT
jgi:hypothetical protein